METAMDNKNEETKDSQVEAKKDHAKAKDEKKHHEKMIKIPAAEHQKMLDEAKENKDKYLRLYAEFDNARKRMDREKQEFIKYANEGLLSEILSILDHMELSLKSAKAHENTASFIKGLEMVVKNIEKLLSENGVKPMNAVGKLFDPYQHEIMIQEESNEFDDNVVIEELQKGYMMHDKVIRISRVKIAKKIENKDQEKQTN